MQTNNTKTRYTLTDQETLQVETEDQEIYLTIHSPGCTNLMFPSVEQAVAFTMPELTPLEQLKKSKDLLDEIITTLQN